MGDCPELFSWMVSKCNCKGPFKRAIRKSKKEDGSVMMETGGKKSM